MEDKEFMRYMISSSDKILPDGIRYRRYQDAYDAAVRFSEKEGTPYYVIEVMFVCNTVAKVPESL